MLSIFSPNFDWIYKVGETATLLIGIPVVTLLVFHWQTSCLRQLFREVTTTGCNRWFGCFSYTNYQPGLCLVMMQLLPRSRMSLRCMDRLASPNRRCSPAWALNNATLMEKTQEHSKKSQHPYPIPIYLIVQLQLCKSWNVLGPFDQNQQLLLHRITNIVYTGQLFVGEIVVIDWGWTHLL